MPKLHGLVEADITINGQPLTFAQAMSLRVAVGSMRMSMTDPQTRAGVGEQLADNYDKHLQSVERMMLANQP